MTIVSNNAITRLAADGYLQVHVGTVARSMIAATFESAYPFFRATSAEKLSNRLSGDFGYRPIGVEYSQSPDRPDPIESFTASIRTSAALAELPSASARILYTRMLSVIEILEAIAESLTIQLANALNGPGCGEQLRGALNGWSSLQLNYSRPADVTAPFIHEAHEDGHLMTIACATGPGLELQTADGGYKQSSTSSEKVLVMPGEIAWLLSGGYIRPLYHRVRPHPGYVERLALLFFVDINPRLCEPWVRNKINKGLDIGSRVLTNSNRFGVSAFTLECE